MQIFADIAAILFVLAVIVTCIGGLYCFLAGIAGFIRPFFRG